MDLGKAFQKIALKHPAGFPGGGFVIHRLRCQSGKVNKQTFSFLQVFSGSFNVVQRWRGWQIAPNLPAGS
jgi:hypothetical protein